MIKAVNHVAITSPKDKIEEMKEFYVGFLDLREIPKPESLKKNGGFWLDGKSVQIHVSIEEGIDRSRFKSHICFEVNSVNTYRDRLGAARLKIIEGTMIPGANRFECRDPAGNRLEIIEFVNCPL